MKNIFGLLFLALLSLTAPVSAQEEDAREIFAALEPSLVAITNAEGGGSGVVLSEKGLIITNFHVANTPLPLTVEAFVTEGGKSVRKTFTDVALFKVHKSSDLALLIIKAPGVSFKPAPISKAEKDTAAGGTCFALGYPFVPDQDKPTLTITKGIISSARRIVGGNPYIQLDAAINPGNSGGALANDKGIVIGIPTLKFEGADRIGLAAPLASLKMDQFVDISERKGDPKEAARLAEMAQNLLIRNLLTFGTDRRVVEIAVFLQREALALEPNNPKWSFDLSSMYFQLEEFTIAAAYSEAAVRLAPDNFPSRTLLADCYNELGETEKAIVQRLECLEFRSTTKDGRKEWAEAIALLARDCAATNRPVQAVYALSWSRSEDNSKPTADQRLIVQKAQTLIPADLFSKIMAKTSGHTVKEMEDLAKNTPLHKPQPPTANLPPADPSKLPGSTTGKAVITSQVSFENPSSAVLVDSPPGVAYDPKTGTLKWTPPPFSPATFANVLFLVTAPDGTEKPVAHVITRE